VNQHTPPQTTTDAINAFFDQVAHLTLEQAIELDFWATQGGIFGYDAAIDAAEDYLDEPTDPAYQLVETSRLLEWEDLRNRLHVPVWKGTRGKSIDLWLGVARVAAETLLALHLQDHLTPDEYDALTDHWHNVIGPLGPQDRDPWASN
jgi:hypothetical protein